MKTQVTKTVRHWLLAIVDDLHQIWCNALPVIQKSVAGRKKSRILACHDGEIYLGRIAGALG